MVAMESTPCALCMSVSWLQMFPGFKCSLASTVPWLQLFPGFKCTLTSKVLAQGIKRSVMSACCRCCCQYVCFQLKAIVLVLNIFKLWEKLKTRSVLLFVKYTLKVLEILCFELALWVCISTNPRYMTMCYCIIRTVWEVKRSRHGVQILCTPSLVSQPAPLPARNGLVNKVEFLGLITKMR